MAATALLAASCTDFDDYNEAYTSGSPESTKTIWENISAREDLSQFAALLKRGGYDKVLSSPSFVTVWAPKNGTYDYDSLMNKVDSVTLVERFIRNHIANYNYNATGEQKRVRLLSGKAYVLDGGNFGSLKMASDGMNIPGINGILHVLENGMAAFQPNIYEYVIESAGDSLSSYFKKYEKPYFDESQSVVGPINEFGEQTYSDSVIVQINELIANHYTGSRGLLNASLNDEDSLYTMIVPTDAAYKATYEKIRSYYRYPANGNMKYKPITVNGLGADQTVVVSSEYTSDSLARQTLAGSLIYSHSDGYNGWWTTGSTASPDVDANDTIRTSLRRKFSNGTEITTTYTSGRELAMSNGYVRIADSLALHPWDSWAPEQEVDIFSERSEDRYVTSAGITSVAVRETAFDTSIGDYIPRYLELSPVSDYSQPDAYFKLSGIKSTAYNVYITLLPANITKVESEENRKQEQLTRFSAEIGYLDEKGNTAVFNFKDAEGHDYLLTDSANLGKIDTFFIGRMDFPYSYATTNASPYLRVRINRGYSSTRTQYSQYFRIGGIILRPVEYDEYLKNEE